MDKKIYSTVKEFCEPHDAFTNGGVRSRIFNETTKGLKASGAIVRLGRKVLINEQTFFQWIENQQ